MLFLGTLWWFSRISMFCVFSSIWGGALVGAVPHSGEGEAGNVQANFEALPQRVGQCKSWRGLPSHASRAQGGGSSTSISYCSDLLVCTVQRAGGRLGASAFIQDLPLSQWTLSEEEDLVLTRLGHNIFGTRSIFSKKYLTGHFAMLTRHQQLVKTALHIGQLTQGHVQS